MDIQSLRWYDSRMKKISSRTFTVIICALAIMISSCSSWVTVRTLEPAEVSLGGRKTIAVASVDGYKQLMSDYFFVPEIGEYSVNPLVPYQRVSLISGYTKGVNSDVASYGQEQLLKGLRATGFFNVIPPEVTDPIVSVGMVMGNTQKKLLEQGIELLLRVSVPSMTFDEHIYTKQAVQYISSHVKEDNTTWAGGDVVMGTNYLLKQTYSMTISYTLLAVDTAAVVSSGTFTSKGDREIKVADSLFPLTSKGDPDYSKQPVFRSYYLSSSVPKDWYNEFFASSMKTLCQKLAPYQGSESYELLEIKGIKEAYKLSDRGSYQGAKNLFMHLWDKERNPDALYNAALLQWAMGDIEGAYKLVQTGLNSSWTSSLQSLASSIESSMARQKKAESQVAGKDELSTSDSFQTQIYQIFGN
jgi:hypothetical protein